MVQVIDTDRAQGLLERAWWVAGSPCSGKTTMAARLARAGGAHLYSCDEAFERLARRARAHGAATFAKVTSWTVRDRLAQDVEDQVADVVRLAGEQWSLVVEDLLDLPGPVVVEGAALLPDLLAGAGVRPGRAVVVVPTEAFQREHYVRRGWARDLIGATAQPEVAFDRWMQRDARFAAVVAEQARARGYLVLVTDSGSTLDVAYAHLLDGFDRLLC